MKKYIGRVCIALSILTNTLFGGKNNQTVSARQWYRKNKSQWNFCWLINFAFADSRHCEKSWIKWEIINSSIQHYDGMTKVVDIPKKIEDNISLIDKARRAGL